MIVGNKNDSNVADTIETVVLSIKIIIYFLKKMIVIAVAIP